MNEKLGLTMKYFVLNPHGDNPHGIASREAILAYAGAIKREDELLAVELRNWVTQCRDELDVSQ